MSYIRPHITSITSASTPGQILVNTGKEYVHQERSFWDKVTDFFSTDQQVLNRYQNRLNGKMKYITNLVCSESVRRKDTYETSGKLIHVYTLGSHEEISFKSFLAPEYMTKEKILFSLMQCASVSEPFKQPRSMRGDIHTVLIDRNGLPVERKTAEIFIDGIDSSSCRFFSDGRNLYINDKIKDANECKDICTRVFEYCLKNRLHPLIGETHMPRGSENTLLVFPDYKNDPHALPQEQRLIKFNHFDRKMPNDMLTVSIATRNMNTILECLDTYIASNTGTKLKLKVNYNPLPSLNGITAFKMFLAEFKNNIPLKTSTFIKSLINYSHDRTNSFCCVLVYSFLRNNTEIEIQLISEYCGPYVTDFCEVVKSFESSADMLNNHRILRTILNEQGVFDDANDVEKFLQWIDVPNVQFTINNLRDDRDWATLAGHRSDNGAEVMSCTLSRRMSSMGEYRGQIMIDSLKSYDAKNGVPLAKTIIQQYLNASTYRAALNNCTVPEKTD